MHVNKLVLGGGISGVAFSHFYRNDDCLLIDKNSSLGGLCRTFKVGESMFDFAGHFLHFNDEEIRQYVLELFSKHCPNTFLNYDRHANIYLIQEFVRQIDFPFQANIHQLAKNDFLQCLKDLYNAKQKEKYSSFEDAVISFFGQKIVELFLKPYNEKLYCTPLTQLDADAMKRFIPITSFSDVMTSICSESTFGYNSSMIYSPSSGIQGLIDAFVKDKEFDYLLNEEVHTIDLINKKVYTENREIEYDTLINTLPLNLFDKLTNKNELSLNYVITDIYNITYDSDCSAIVDKSWTYFPKGTSFYRIGFYNYFSKKQNTSIYVEVSRKKGQTSKTLIEIDEELKTTGVISKSAKIVDSNELHISPGYVILEKDTDKVVSEYMNNCPDTYFLGRYGRWTYDSMGDNIKNARDLAIKLSL